ncbi:MAG TPA: hypothetical protein DG761_07135 [Gammaproteobacteria bacterium]|nr:hypothetical protein [Gammaproteobacteria bacterium]|tara:strand:- start:111 stop:395 length:285 start_codon:yes stop_codon:yes gene_type:complete
MLVDIDPKAVEGYGKIVSEGGDAIMAQRMSDTIERYPESLDMIEHLANAIAQRQPGIAIVSPGVIVRAAAQTLLLALEDSNKPPAGLEKDPDAE